MIYLIIILAVLSRFIPHLPNFAPITAIAMFSAYYLGWKQAVGLTLAIRFISDVFLGFVAWPMMVAIYLSHLVGVLFGVWVKNSSHPPLWKRGGVTVSSPSLAKEGVGGVVWLKVFVSSLGASIIFFLVTNFAFLYSNYSHNLSGIIESYINGLPFLRGTVMGDMFYSVALFGGLALVKKYQLSTIKSQNLEHRA